jgi:hypothetical protein
MHVNVTELVWEPAEGEASCAFYCGLTQFHCS